jgi:Mn2+/Fe2+ NRAMP family transporter
MIQKAPFALTVLGMIGGVFIAIIFGINEDYIKDKISLGLQENVKISSIADSEQKESTLKAEKDKNWRYYQRYHFHATAIGAMSLGSLILLAFSTAPTLLTNASSYMISIGGLLYPFVWLFAGIYGPSMGRHEAKEAFAIFGYMGGVFLVGLILLLFIIGKYPFRFIKN